MPTRGTITMFRNLNVLNVVIVMDLRGGKEEVAEVSARGGVRELGDNDFAGFGFDDGLAGVRGNIWGLRVRLKWIG